MVQTSGWEILKKYIEENISSIQYQLCRADFEDLNKVLKLQSEMRAYEKIMMFVEKRLNNVDKIST